MRKTGQRKGRREDSVELVFVPDLDACTDVHMRAALSGIVAAVHAARDFASQQRTSLRTIRGQGQGEGREVGETTKLCECTEGILAVDRPRCGTERREESSASEQ